MAREHISPHNGATMAISDDDCQLYMHTNGGAVVFNAESVMMDKHDALEFLKMCVDQIEASL